jgi:predicted nicotinamide N-methyase
MAQHAVLSLDRGSLEQALRKRVAPPPRKSSWERETARGIHHSFEEYRLKITAASGSEEEVVIDEDCSSLATRVWDCAVVTSKWLESIATRAGHPCPDLVASLQLKSETFMKRPIQVLELGAGTGLLNMCLAKMGAAVMSTEYGSAVRCLRENCDRNNVTMPHTMGSSQATMKSGFVTCRELDWFKTTETLQTLFAPNEQAIFDLIVVTDCSLTNKESKGVINMIHKYGTKGHTKVIFGVCNEREGTPYIMEAAVKDFQEVVLVPTSDHHTSFQTTRQKIVICLV